MIRNLIDKRRNNRLTTHVALIWRSSMVHLRWWVHAVGWGPWRWHWRHHTSWRWPTLLLKLHQESLVVFDLVLDVFTAFSMLLATERRRVLQVNSTVLAEKVWHLIFNY